MIATTAIKATTKPLFISREGLKEIKAKLTDLLHQHRDMRTNIRNLNDQLSPSTSLEDSAWQTTLMELQELESEIDNLRLVIAKAHLINSPADNQTIALGSKIKLQANGTLIECQLVGSIEADPSVGKISDESPLGRALMGRAVNDCVNISTNRNKECEYKIIAIS